MQLRAMIFKSLVVISFLGINILFFCGVESLNCSTILLGFTGFHTLIGPPFQVFKIGSALQIALDTIHTNESILFNKTLGYVFDDSGCSEKKGIDSVVTLVRDYHVDAIVGPACTYSAVGVGKLASQWNVPVVAYGGSSARLSDKFIFTSYSRTVPLTSEIGSAIAWLSEFLAWKTLCVYEIEGQTHFGHIIDGLEKYLPQINGTLVKPFFQFKTSQVDEHNEIVNEMKSKCRGKLYEFVTW